MKGLLSTLVVGALLIAACSASDDTDESADALPPGAVGTAATDDTDQDSEAALSTDEVPAFEIIARPGQERYLVSPDGRHVVFRDDDGARFVAPLADLDPEGFDEPPATAIEIPLSSVRQTIRWSQDSTRLAIYNLRRGPRDEDNAVSVFGLDGSLQVLLPADDRVQGFRQFLADDRFLINRYDEELATDLLFFEPDGSMTPIDSATGEAISYGGTHIEGGSLFGRSIDSESLVYYVWTMDLDTREFQRIDARTPEDDPDAPVDVYGGLASPTGDHMLALSRPDVERTAEAGLDYPTLRLVDLSSSTTIILRHGDEAIDGPLEVAWSPEGDRMALLSVQRVERSLRNIVAVYDIDEVIEAGGLEGVDSWEVVLDHEDGAELQWGTPGNLFFIDDRVLIRINVP